MRLTEGQRRLVEEILPSVRDLTKAYANRTDNFRVWEELFGYVCLQLCITAVRMDPEKSDSRWKLFGRAKYAIKEWFWEKSRLSIFNGVDEYLIESYFRSHRNEVDTEEADRILAMLTEKQRNSLLLKMAGFTESEIAAELGCSLESAKKRAEEGLRMARKFAEGWVRIGGSDRCKLSRSISA